MLTAENTGLVPGAPMATSHKQVAVRVTRSFMFGGMAVAAGTERSFDAGFAASLVATGKAERVAEVAAVLSPAKPKPPAPTKPTPTKD